MRGRCPSNDKTGRIPGMVMTTQQSGDEPPFDGDDFETLMGRPTVFNQEIADRVIEGVSRGLTMKNAASYGGISYSTLNRWRRRGEDSNEDDEFCQFWKRLERAKGEAALRLLNCVNSAAESGEWKAATWILERRYPDEWGKNASGHDPVEPIFDF